MGLRLIRQKSETPNILSTDDARMVRYAYGGYDGVVKNRGTECGYEASGNTFKITSGVIVLQGWEVEIDGNGWQITVDSMTKYYAVYLEVNLSTDTAEIKSVYDTTGIPAVNVGDDLTRTTNGTARMVLYTFKTMGNTISNVVKKVDSVNYVSSFIGELLDGSLIPKISEETKKINDIELKLEEGQIRYDESNLIRIKEIWSGNLSGKYDSPVSITLNEAVSAGRYIIKYLQDSYTYISEGMFFSESQEYFNDLMVSPRSRITNAVSNQMNMSFYVPMLRMKYGSKEAQWSGVASLIVRYNNGSVTYTQTYTSSALTKIYKIIE